MFAIIRPFVVLSVCVLSFSPVISDGEIFKQPTDIRYALFKGQQAPSRELVHTLGLQSHWDDEGGALNPSGLQLHFEKIATPAAARGAVRYRVFAEGAAEDKVFAFGTWTLSKDLTVDPRDLYVNGQGLLMQRQPTPDQDLSLSADDEFEVAPEAGSGEAIRYLLARRDGQVRIYGTLVPHPIVDEVQGCRLEARIAQPNTKAVLMVLDGFPAGDKIPLVLESGGMSISELLDTDENGHAVIAVFPYVPGKTQGTLKASAEGPNCLPSVTLPWGPDPGAAPKSDAAQKDNPAAAKSASH